ncbi:MAG: geranylgeranyl pyrophosphate synthase [Chlamydiales bacterium]
MSATERTAWFEGTRVWVEVQLDRALGDLAGTPPLLLEAMRYSLFGGGKRVRPALVRAACNLVGGTDEQAGRAAAAVELLHTYSLVHDDLPCMDDDDLRRGRPTCHKVYGEALAVLVGDGLQAAAFEQTASIEGEGGARTTACLARAAGALGMVGGQQLDLAAEVGASVGDVVEIHHRKTGALLVASVELGVLAAHPEWARPDAPEAGRLEALRDYGRALGLCFQAVDDLLDVTGDAGSLGKTPGKDVAAGKATLVAAQGLDGARESARRAAKTAEAAARRAGATDDHPTLWIVEALLDRKS